jgi:hypothetical protein
MTGGAVRVKNKTVCFAALVLSVGMAGCSGSESSTSDVTPPADGGTFATIDDLKEAVESAGLVCPELVLHNHAKYSASSGTCSENISLAVYSNDASLQWQLDLWKPIGQSAINVGKNWTVVSADPKRIQTKLGGTVLHTGP